MGDEKKMIWDECFVARTLSKEEIVTGVAEVFGISNNKVRVFSADEWENYLSLPGIAHEPLLCRFSQHNGAFPMQIHFYVAENIVTPPQSRGEALHQLATIWRCSIITSFGPLDYLVDERGKTHIWVDEDWLEEHNEVIYKIATDEAQSDE